MEQQNRLFNDVNFLPSLLKLNITKTEKKVLAQFYFAKDGQTANQINQHVEVHYDTITKVMRKLLKEELIQLRFHKLGKTHRAKSYTISEKGVKLLEGIWKSKPTNSVEKNR